MLRLHTPVLKIVEYPPPGQQGLYRPVGLEPSERTAGTISNNCSFQVALYLQLSIIGENSGNVGCCSESIPLKMMKILHFALFRQSMQ